MASPMPGLIVAVAVALAGCGGPTATPSRPEPSAPAPAVFAYSGTNGEFGYSLELYADGRWTRSEHSGHAKPEGRLSPEAMRSFLALVAAAPFRSESSPCAGGAIGHATYNDLQGGRVARASQSKGANGSWVPCGEQVDDATARLPGCLEMLIDGQDAEKVGCAPAASPASAPLP